MKNDYHFEKACLQLYTNDSYQIFGKNDLEFSCCSTWQHVELTFLNFTSMYRVYINCAKLRQGYDAPKQTDFLMLL